MALNIELNEKLAIRIFSFPMRYQPTDMKDRSFVGENWNRYYLRSMQIILQATHGIVSGAPEYFRRAFGSSVDEFERLLTRPHKFIFNRVWFEELGGKDEFEEYQREATALSSADRSDLLSVLSSLENCRYDEIASRISNQRVAKHFRFYRPLVRDAEYEIWNKLKSGHLASWADPKTPGA
jgi:hypothetical protein